MQDEYHIQPDTRVNEILKIDKRAALPVELTANVSNPRDVVIGTVMGWSSTVTTTVVVIASAGAIPIDLQD